MFRFVKVLGRVLILGRIATADIAANHTHAQMNPSIAHLNAVLTHMLVRLSYFDLVEMGALFRHRFLLSLLILVRHAACSRTTLVYLSREQDHRE
jgi:hypothetical protein